MNARRGFTSLSPELKRRTIHERQGDGFSKEQLMKNKDFHENTKGCLTTSSMIEYHISCGEPLCYAIGAAHEANQKFTIKTFRSDGWLANHFRMPYVDWLPVDDVIRDWLDKNYRFVERG
jgi:hypothetical protein